MMRTTEEEYPGRMAKQPQWLQRRIKELEGHITRLQAKLSAGPEDSEAWADPHSDAPRPLGKKPVVRFGSREDDGAEFTVYFRDGRLVINATGETVYEEFAVIPRAANEVIIAFAAPAPRNDSRKG